MLFHTPAFAAFFIAAFAAAWGTRRWPVLHLWTLAGFSFAFYGAWDWRFMGLLFASCAGNWAAALAVAATQGAARRRWVALAVAGNLGVLATFKYFDFFVAQANDLAAVLGLAGGLPYAGLILPVGISFFTFQGISYVVDVHRGEIAPSRRLVEVLVYIAFFPQLVAGPIVRAAALMPQVRARALIPEGPARIAAGFGAAMILSGLFKKLVLANWIAFGLTDAVFFAPADYGAADLWLAAYGYAVQIYCDFSGYSDMAIGLAALLGFHITRNFDQPFRAASMQEFWRRWHISLSTWLRDYLYIPLGGSRGGERATRRNLMVTMLLGGLWHGAAWTFVLWGFLHGAFLVAGRALPRVPRWLGVVVTFHLVVFTFALFRSESLGLFGEFMAGLLSPGPGAVQATPFLAALVAFGIALHFLPPRLPEAAGRALDALPWPVLGAVAGAALAAIGLMAPDAVTPFIYFQF